MGHIDLMKNYPKSDRSKLLKKRREVTSVDRAIAQQFGKDYFDGPRHLGLGGYHYDSKYFVPVVRDMIRYYGLNKNASILDIGCGKGFMMKDFKDALPDASIYGIDISKYCIENSLPEVASSIFLGSCDNLPFPDASFDLVISIATIHNLGLEGVKKSLREITRVSRGSSYIKINGYENEEEKKNLNDWNLVAKTILHVDEWEQIFREVGYNGDYSFFCT